jgi:hypothetical protein
MMKKRKITQELFASALANQSQGFTITELKSAYMVLPGCVHRTDKAAWQFVYRQVVRLEKKGLLQRVEGPHGDRARYQRTGQDTAVNTVSNIDTNAQNNSAELGDDMTLRCLKEKLHRYQIEMLSAIGETEEYDAICSELPHMQDAVQELYNEARDRCSKILGRVKALESILSTQCQPHLS